MTKGIVHTAGAQYKDVEPEAVPDDPQTTFYKRHMQRTQAPHVSGSTPIYDFDEWNEKHYGKAFQRNQEAKKRFNAKPIQEMHEENSVKYEIFILGGMTLLTVLLYLVVKFDSSNPDEISHPKKGR